MGNPSNLLFIIPTASDDEPTARLAAWMDEIRNVFVASANLLAWIQGIQGSGTTANHVYLGYEPRAVIKDTETEGPSVFIWPENYVTNNVQSAGTYAESFDIVAEVIWFQDHKTAAKFIAEINFLSKIIDEFKAKKTALSTSFGGEVFTISSADMVTENPNKRDERRVEIRFSVRSGRED